MDVCGPAPAQRLAVAGRRTGLAPHRGLGAWLSRGRHGQAVVGRAPARYQRHCRYHTDHWEAYAKVLPAHHHRPHPKGSGKTNIVEAINCSLRQRCGVLVRKSCSFSKNLRMHTGRIKIVIDNYNLTL